MNLQFVLDFCLTLCYTNNSEVMIVYDINNIRQVCQPVFNNFKIPLDFCHTVCYTIFSRKSHYPVNVVVYHNIDISMIKLT